MAAEFAQRLRNLYHHALDEHGECDFHSETVCSCGKCEDRNAPQCAGKQYHTRNKLTCPFHQLAYKIEIERRAGMADSLVHPDLKRGHSNWLEASHNILIQFRSKHIYRSGEASLSPVYRPGSPTGQPHVHAEQGGVRLPLDPKAVPEDETTPLWWSSGGSKEVRRKERQENEGDKGGEEQKEENTTQSETYTGTGREKAVEQATRR